MKARTWVAVSTLALIAGLGLVDLERAQPGPLSAVHGSLPELAGGRDCAACHGGWFGDLTSACLDCHEGIDEDLRAGTGLHGTQPEGLDGRRCGLCHGEHHGEGFDIAGPRAFAITGIGAREDVDHGRFGFELGGAHLELDCSECHEAADLAVLPEGTPRFRGLEADCASCHESEHPPAFGDDCAACHVQDDFADQAWPDHARVFDLTGVHGEADCAACHEGETRIERQLQRLARDEPAEARACAACHEAPHGMAFLVASTGDAPSFDAVCAACHDTAGGTFRDAADHLAPGAHAATGFELSGPHADLGCAACHGEAEAFADRHPGRVADDCAACHLDPHGGQFVDPGARDAACIDCHDRDAFAPTTFDAARHAELALGLEGAHGRAACADCHGELEHPVIASPDPDRLTAVDSFDPDGSPQDPRPVLSFRGTDPTCAACHEDAHAGFFAGSAVHGAGGGGDADRAEASPDCAGCHGFEAFAPASSGFDHGRDCGFALSGAHGQVDCAPCHDPVGTEGTTPGAFHGFLELADLGGAPAAPRRAEAGLDQDCARCHTSRHGDAFGNGGGSERPGDLAADLPGDPAATAHAGGRACVTCHEPVSFALAAEGFDHGATGFELGGRHGELDCGSCHGTTWAPGPDGTPAPSRLSLAGASCTSCHADPHGGQFTDADPDHGRAADPGACARCHDPARTFGETTFVHDLDSRFRLEGRHAELACAACHEPVEGDGGEAFVYYRPLSMECNSCHGVQRDGGLRRSGG